MTERTILEDAQVFLGLPPHEGWSNHCAGDGYFQNDCKRHWGEQQFRDACAEARRLHTIGMAAYEKAKSEATSTGPAPKDPT